MGPGLESAAPGGGIHRAVGLTHQVFSIPLLSLGTLDLTLT